jgi:GxxExxY protein
LESVYLLVLAYELTKGGLGVEVQKWIPIRYDELCFEEGYRADLIVGKKILLELKSAETPAACSCQASPNLSSSGEISHWLSHQFRRTAP